MAKLVSGIVVVFALFFIQAVVAHSKKQSTGVETTYRANRTFYSEDAWIELNNRESNHDQTEFLQVTHNRSRTIVQFRDTRNAILQEFVEETKEEVTIISAILRFTIINVACWVDPDIAIHHLPTFNQRKATWDCSDYDTDDCCQRWRMIGLLPQVQASYEAEPTDVQQIHKGQTGRLEFNVYEDYVEYFEKNDSPTIGWLLKKVVESLPGTASFWSSNSHPVGTVVEPELIVVWETKKLADPVVPEPQAPCPDDQWNWDEPVQQQ